MASYTVELVKRVVVEVEVEVDDGGVGDENKNEQQAIAIAIEEAGIDGAWERAQAVVQDTQPVQPDSMPYTSEIGEAGQRYFDSFGFGCCVRTPGTFRFEELWDQMLAAARGKA